MHDLSSPIVAASRRKSENSRCPGPMRILVIDDDAAATACLARLLGAAGHEVKQIRVEQAGGSHQWSHRIPTAFRRLMFRRRIVGRLELPVPRPRWFRFKISETVKPAGGRFSPSAFAIRHLIVQ